MTLPHMRVEWKMSVGNMIAIAVLAFGVVQFWIQMDERQQQLVKYVERVEEASAARMNGFSEAATVRNERITRLEIQAAAFNSDIRSINTGLARIENLLRDMRQERSYDRRGPRRNGTEGVAP